MLGTLIVPLICMFIEMITNAFDVFQPLGNRGGSPLRKDPHAMLGFSEMPPVAERRWKSSATITDIYLIIKVHIEEHSSGQAPKNKYAERPAKLRD